MEDCGIWWYQVHDRCDGPAYAGTENKAAD